MPFYYDEAPFNLDELDLGIGVSRELNGIDKSVSAAILSLSEINGFVIAVPSRIAGGLGVSEERVRSSLKRLEAKGLIKTILEPDISALAALGDQYRARREQLVDGEEE
ncbi:hypothetical protein GFB56_09895 [Ensifer sp. T173]|uniref:HTH crp-type domain-containing protein n=1 Tax=Ensifer canadensis TaxID=555315 RepID=A0AAW4FG69_9HYPH|nr:hypothetical protein [Ensifer canadensis]MBM3091128.1 hypothetical protein [Ensifer canadensis]UBI75818.1 helix-turn-helix domain-containing protein [Ensifer canadensis]